MGSRKSYQSDLSLGEHKWSFSLVELDSSCQRLHPAMSSSSAAHHSCRRKNRRWLSNFHINCSIQKLFLFIDMSVFSLYSISWWWMYHIKFLHAKLAESGWLDQSLSQYNTTMESKNKHLAWSYNNAKMPSFIKCSISIKVNCKFKSFQPIMRTRPKPVVLGWPT